MRTAIAIAILLLTCIPARAQPAPCGPHKDVLSNLANKYRERVVAQAASPEGNLVEVTASPSGTWTMLVTNSSGLTCFFANGSKWISKVWPDHQA